MSKNFKNWLLPGLSTVAVFVLFSGMAATSGRTSDERSSELANLVRQDCGSCHGMTLKGGLGKALLPASLKESTVSEIREIILDGIAGTPMPGWRGLLSDDDAHWIAESLKAGTIKRGNL